MRNTDAADIYRSEAGQTYLEQRTGAASEHNQTLRASLFTDLASEDHVLLDFGCGTGGVLTRLPARQRVGVEIGAASAAVARTSGIDVVSVLTEIETASIDIAISFHAIEHVERPADVLRELSRVVKPGQPLRLIVPGESPHDPRQARWRENADMHLFTWTPLLFGNLARLAGLVDIRTRLAPMPTGSRLVKLAAPLPPLARRLHARVAHRLNAWNVILDARAPL